MELARGHGGGGEGGGVAGYGGVFVRELAEEEGAEAEEVVCWGVGG